MEDKCRSAINEIFKENELIDIILEFTDIPPLNRRDTFEQTEYVSWINVIWFFTCLFFIFFLICFFFSKCFAFFDFKNAYTHSHLHKQHTHTHTHMQTIFQAIVSITNAMDIRVIRHRFKTSNY